VPNFSPAGPPACAVPPSVPLPIYFWLARHLHSYRTNMSPEQGSKNLVREHRVPSFLLLRVPERQGEGSSCWMRLGAMESWHRRAGAWLRPQLQQLLSWLPALPNGALPSPSVELFFQSILPPVALDAFSLTAAELGQRSSSHPHASNSGLNAGEQAQKLLSESFMWLCFALPVLGAPTGNKDPPHSQISDVFHLPGQPVLRQFNFLPSSSGLLPVSVR